MLRFVVGILLGSVLLSWAAVAVSTPDLRFGPYVIDEALFLEGCFDPCMCPILEHDDVEGGFVLVPTGIVDGFMTFDVNDVVWTVGETDRIVFRGSGTYRISLGVDSQHELILDLSRDDGPVEHFSSGGLVLAHQPFRGVDIAISRNGFYCFDTVFEIHASHRDHPTTWGAIKSLFATN